MTEPTSQLRERLNKLVLAHYNGKLTLHQALHFAYCMGASDDASTEEG